MKKLGLGAVLIAALVAPLAVYAVEQVGVDGSDRKFDSTITETIGGQQVNITEGAGGSVTIPLGATAVSATFLDADGETLDLGSAFELRLNSTNTARVTFTRSGPFAGTLNGLTAGNAVVEVVLWHIEEQHEDFGPQNLTVTVQ